MSDANERANIIWFAFSSNRLVISKSVLKTLSNPKFIQIFVSLDRTTLFIKGCDTKGTQCFTVPPRVYVDVDYKYTLRKAAFSEAICSATGFDKKGRYRLYGVPVSSEVIGFSFADADRLDNMET